MQQRYVWTVDADIERYFESVPHKKLLEQLARYVTDERVVDLVARWLEAYSDTGLGLPQGGPISPLLANLYLDSVDEEIEKHGARLVRYADDFVILCKSRGAAQGALERVGALLKERGLKLNPEKTRLVGYDEKLRFLGRLFVRSMMLRPTEAEEVPEEQRRAPEPAHAALPSPPDHILISQSPPTEAAPPENYRGADEEQDESGDGAPGLRVLYLMEPGRRLELRNEAFAVWEADTLAAAIPPQRVDRIEIGPAVQVNDAALRHAMVHGIAVAFVDGRGETLGWLAPPDDARGGLHRAQAAVMLDPVRRLDLAKRIVEGRLRSQRAQLRRLAPKSADSARVWTAEVKVALAKALAGGIALSSEASVRVPLMIESMNVEIPSMTPILPAREVLLLLHGLFEIRNDRAVASSARAFSASLVNRMAALARWQDMEMIFGTHDFDADGVEISYEPPLPLGWTRRSSAQRGRRIPMIGSHGRMTLKGRIEPLLPFLRVGELAQIGGRTTFGYGRYELVLLP